MPLVLIFISMCIALILSMGVDWMGWSPTADERTSELMHPALFFLLAFSATTLIYVSTSFHNSVLFVNIKAFIKKPPTLILLFSLHILIAASIHAISARTSWVVYGSDMICDGEVSAAWIGSESVVATCDPANSQIFGNKGFFVVPRNGLHFVKAQ